MADNINVEVSARDTRKSLSRSLPVLGPFIVVAVCAVGILMASGVKVLDILRFMAYEAGFVFLPGWLLYLAWGAKRGGLLRQIAVGWGLGYVLEILVFAITSALGVRPWFVGYPILAAMLIAPSVRRRYRSWMTVFSIRSQDTRWSWGLALVCTLALIYLSIGYFAETPLPETVESVRYYVDIPWHLGMAAEAKHHWPITDPHVAGEPFSYYTFVYMHLAAASHVTGLALPLVLFRLYIVPMFILLVIQLYVLGTVLGGNRWIGLLTAILVLFVGEVDPFPRLAYPFTGVFFPDLYLSPTFLLGLVLFIPLVIEVYGCINSSASVLSRRGNWLLVALLLIGCGGAKGTILPVVGGGLGLYLIWNWWTERRLNFAVLTGLGLTLVVSIGCYFVYGNSVSGDSLSIGPLSSVIGMSLVRRFSVLLPNSKPFRLLYYGLAVIPGFVGLMGIRVVGLAWLGWSARAGFSKAQAWLISLFLISLVPYYMLARNQLYFLWYGYVAACALAAQGLYMLWQQRQRSGFLFRLPISISLIVLLLLGIIDMPLDNASRVWGWLRGELTYSQVNRNLTSGLLQGMNWLREHADTNAVLAVNNYYRDEAGTDARYFCYSAFSERRVFLEGWMYTHKAHRVGWGRVWAGKVHPFPDRLDLNQRVFVEADPSAIDVMVRQYGVTYLFVDKVHSAPVPDLTDVARLVYANPDVEIYAVKPSQ